MTSYQKIDRNPFPGPTGFPGITLHRTERDQKDAPIVSDRDLIPRHTRLLRVDPASPDSDILREAAETILRGGLVAIPTETVYGLAANAWDDSAVKSIFATKKRPSINPLIVHVADEVMVKSVVAAWPPMARELAAKFWPGPLTLVLPKAATLPDAVTAGGSTVAVRWPTHAVALGVIRAAGVPLAAPSANLSGELSPTRADHVLRSLAGRIDLILDAGPTTAGIESTVIDLTHSPPRLLRPGPISVAQIEAVIGPLARLKFPAETLDAVLPSPGMLARHYAPRTRLEIVAAEHLRFRTAELTGQGERVGTLCSTVGSDWDQNVVRLSCDAVEFAARLFEVLHDLDGRGLTVLLVERPPDTDDWLAVSDRLARAATPA